MTASSNDDTTPKLVVTFRGQKMEQRLTPDTSVGSVKEHIVEKSDPEWQLQASDVKLMYKGKVLAENAENLYQRLVATEESRPPKKAYHIMATGRSSTESARSEKDTRERIEAAPRIRDDLTDQGKKQMERRKRLGLQMMQQTRNTMGAHDVGNTNYGFGTIETLPNLPQRDQARKILETLANDPGVLACMAKHKWKVGSLAELYPEGKVGESEVCVMGLNQNRGMRILLRIRTDDLKGFRKMLSIRKVLFHELAHNVHSEHDGKFFQLMRQIESECNDMDWTQGEGLTPMTDNAGMLRDYEGGTFRLGNGKQSASTETTLSPRELAARAALRRMTAEEQEIQNNYGCGRQNLFLPPGKDEPMDE